MKSIKEELIISKIAVVLLSAVIISVPITVRQYFSLIQQAEESADSKIAQTCTDINLFLQKPIQMVKAAGAYAANQDLTNKRDETESFLEKVLGQETELIGLCYGNDSPCNKGGIFYSADHWIPDESYDQTSRSWYILAKQNKGIQVSPPYIDATTKQPITSV